MKTSRFLISSLLLVVLSIINGAAQITFQSPSVRSVHTGDDSGNENYYLNFSISVSNQAGLAGTTVKVTSPSNQEYTLYDDGTHNDDAADDGIFGNSIDNGNQPVLTGNYLFTISDNDETETVTDILNYVIQYPQGLSPAMNAAVSENPVFWWINPDDVASYVINVFDDNHLLIWTGTGKGNVCFYSGPQLVNSKTYFWQVEVQSGDALGRHTESSFIYDESPGLPQIFSARLTLTHFGNDSGDNYYTLNSWCRVSDPQGLSDIENVKVVDPNNRIFNLLDLGDYLGRYGKTDTLAEINTGTYIFSVTDKAGSTSQIGVPINSVIDYPHNLLPANNVIVTETPVFSWSPVEGATSYAVQVFKRNFCVWQGNTSETTLKYNNDGNADALLTDSVYSWTVISYSKYCMGQHEFQYFTYNGDPNMPRFTMLSVSYNKTQDYLNNQITKTYLMARVDDPQGIDNIQSVFVTDPDNNTFNLYQGPEQPNNVFYTTKYFTGLPSVGNYQFTVTNNQGKYESANNLLNKVFDLPANTIPANHALVNQARPVFEWDEVPGSDYYNLYIKDEYNNYIWSYQATNTSVQFNCDGSALPLVKGRSYYWDLGAYSGPTSCLVQSKFTYDDSEHSDSLALVALFNSTNGPNWTRNDNWLQGPLNTWYGVIVENERIKILDLFNNNLNGSIPPEIGWLTGLSTLQLASNNFNGSSLPSEIGNLVNLDNLYLYWSNLGGVIPKEIGNLTNLHSMILGHNNLTGIIPEEIGNLVNLVILGLYENQLTGPIPVTIGRMSMLFNLNLGFNYLSGELPPTLYSLPNLNYLSLYFNGFTGIIPPEIGNLHSLRSLDISNNQFNGEIPEEIGNLANLDYVQLNDNQFTGDIPQSFRNLTNLTFFSLQNNQFSELPDLSLFNNLNILQIFGNKFTFEDIEPNIGIPQSAFNYNPQQSVGETGYHNVNEGESIHLSVSVGGEHNVYQWYKDNSLIQGMTSDEIIINKARSDDAGTYICYITNTIAPDLTLYSNPIYVSVNEMPHFTPAWQGTSGLDHMNFYAVSAQIDGSDMQPGDEVGIFDGNVCIGMGTVTSTVSNQNLLEIRVSKDDPYTPAIDGYTEGHLATFKIWDDQNQVELHDVSVVYIAGNSTLTAGASAFVEIHGSGLVNQAIPLQSGWNIFSLNVIPENTSMMNIAQHLISSGSLVKIQNESGAAIEMMPGNAGWLDYIGNWGITEGYKIRLSKADTIVVAGEQVNSPVNIPLQSGWNIIGYPYSTQQDAMSAFNSIISNNHLLKIQNEAGFAIEQLPAGMGWINNIGMLLPGEGYKVRVSANEVLALAPASAGFTGDLKSAGQSLPLTHFKPVWSGNGVDQMNIYLNGTFNDGDEIGIFDGEICVGAIKTSLYADNYLSVVASSDDPVTMETDGFQKGNALSVRIWNPVTGTETLPGMTLLPGYSGTFEPMGTTFATLSSTGLLTELGRNYPNPFREETHIPFKVSETGQVELMIYDVMGHNVAALVNEVLKADSYTITWDGTGANHEKLNAGVYICRLKAGNTVLYRMIELLD